MKNICANCKHHSLKTETSGFWIFKTTEETSLCMHENAKDDVTGEPQRCSTMRMFPISHCSEKGNWFEEK